MTSPYPMTCRTRTVAEPPGAGLASPGAPTGHSRTARWSSAAGGGMSTASGRPYRRNTATTASGGMAATRANVAGSVSSGGVNQTALEREGDHLPADLGHLDGRRVLLD